MTSRSFILLVFLVLVAMSVLAAFLKPAPSITGKQALIWTTDPNPQREPQVESFNEMYPSHELRTDPDNSGVMKVVVQCSAGMGPDIIGRISPVNYETYSEAGILMDLTDLAQERGFGPETLHPSVRPLVLMPVLNDNGSIEQRQFIYPCNVAHTFLLYNKGLFDARGVPYPSEDMTWKEYIALAQKMTVTRLGEKIPHIFGGAGVQHETIIWGMGGDWMNKEGTRCTLDSEKVVDALTFWHDLFHRHKVEPTPVQKAGVQSQGGWGGGYISWFGEGKIAMYWGARWNLIQLRRFISEQKKIRKAWRLENPYADQSEAPHVLKLGACLVPRFEGRKRVTKFGARGAGINIETKNLEGSLSFLSYLASETYSRHINHGADSKPGNMEFNYLDAFLHPDWPEEREIHEASLRAIPDGHTPPRSMFVSASVVERNFRDARDKLISDPSLDREAIAGILSKAALQVNREIARNIKRNPHLQKAYDSYLKDGAEPLVINLEEVD